MILINGDDYKVDVLYRVLTFSKMKQFNFIVKTYKRRKFLNLVVYDMNSGVSGDILPLVTEGSHHPSLATTYMGFVMF